MFQTHLSILAAHLCSEDHHLRDPCFRASWRSTHVLGIDHPCLTQLHCPEVLRFTDSEYHNEGVHAGHPFALRWCDAACGFLDRCLSVRFLRIVQCRCSGARRDVLHHPLCPHGRITEGHPQSLQKGSAVRPWFPCRAECLSEIADWR